MLCPEFPSKRPRWWRPPSRRSSPSPTAAYIHRQLSEVADTLSFAFPDVASLLEESKADLLAFSSFPMAHWTKLWSTNPLERVNAEIKRRTNVVGIFRTTPLC
jgi:transposase-like protein